MPQPASFFYDGALTENSTVSLDADTAKHIWQVLRMEADDKVILTDGKGTTAEGRIYTAERHKCNVAVGKVTFHKRSKSILHLAVAFTKNNSRNEWLLEKATELGVGTIIPIVTARSEKTHVRDERWHRILQAAILQSQQYYLPVLTDLMPLPKLLQAYQGVPNRMIAHCVQEAAKRPLHQMLKSPAETLFLVGPEGDFTKEEVNLCIEHGFRPVSLGRQRLRTETAAIAVAAYFNAITDEEDN